MWCKYQKSDANIKVMVKLKKTGPSCARAWPSSLTETERGRSGILSSRTRRVMTMAKTPSLRASMRCLLTRRNGDRCGGTVAVGMSGRIITNFDLRGGRKRVLRVTCNRDFVTEG